MNRRTAGGGSPWSRRFLRAAPVLVLLGCAVAWQGDGAVSAAGAAGGPEAEIGGRIAGERRLSGTVAVKEDLLVLPGATLVLAPGTALVFAKSESSKVDPEYFHAGTEIVVRGKLTAEGAEFRFPDRSGGIVVDGGTARLSDCLIRGAEAGIAVTGGGVVDASGPVRVRDCRVGVALFPGGGARAWKGKGEVLIERNAVAVALFPGATLPGTFRLRESEEADRVAWEEGPGGNLEDGPPAVPPSPDARRMGDTFLERDLTLSGEVIVDGVIRVAPGARLTLAPGTRLYFTFRDTDGDGIGENGLFLQGNLSARGTRERPIGIYPLVPGGRGRWDAVNFMASDQGENLLEHVDIAGAYRGLHAHFSRLKGKAIRISRCFRGIQFQESEVDLEGVEVVAAASVLRCRDSNVKITGFVSRGGVAGANFLRSTVRLVSFSVESPGWYGLRFRESRADVASGSVRNGFTGISVQEGTLRADRLDARDSGLAGYAVLDGDVKMENCVLRGSRLDALDATRGTVSVSGGSFAGYGRFAVKLGGPADVVLRGVETGAGKGGRVPIRDGTSVPGLGVVRVE